MAKEFLGRGWKFPIRMNSRGIIDISEYEVSIKESINVILKTSKGERVMQPDFGCGIYDYLFESTDDGSLRMIEESVKDSLTAWEPRIDLNDVIASLDEAEDGKILINVSYTVRTTNNEFNLVYPFYLKE